MMAFASLEDTPMFRKQLNSAENTAYELKDRCQKFYKGCKIFMTSIGDSCNGDLSFAESLEAFGAGNDDPISVAIGGPVMSKFTTAFRELSTYKELLRSQVEHMLSDRLYEFITTDLQDLKDARRHFEKAQLSYDQAREKVMSLKKGAHTDVVTALEEDMQNAKSTFERCRFNLVNALANIEAKKKYEFLESISAVMDAQMRYFKQGYQLLNQMEPFIHQILTYTQQSKEMTKTENDNLAKRIQEFRTQEQLDSLKSHSETEASTNGDGIHTVGTSSYKSIEALMQSSVNGQVQTIKQGYLLKQSSNVRGDWKRRFFVLDSHGTLYYYRNNNRQSGSQLKQSISIPEQSIGVFSRFRFAHRRSLSQDEVNLSCHTVDLRTSTVKIDAEQSDLRFCFRIISPLKCYTLQAENVTERADWVAKITAVITSLLTSPFPNQSGSQSVRGDRFSAADGSIPHLGNNYTYKGKNGIDAVQHDVCKVLKKVPGNDICAECGSSEPDWASLNLGVLLCIECSGIHRNLGVHISKIRSLTLDVRVWESSVLDLFCALGNSYCNSIWEELLYHKDDRIDEQNEFVASITKPAPRDSNSLKEKYIQLKYAEKRWVAKTTKSGDLCAALFWEAIKTSNVQEAYRLLVVSDANPNTTYEMTFPCDLWHNTDVHRVIKNSQGMGKQYDPACCQKIKDTGEPAECRQGCAALHLACHKSDLVMLELLLQSGADINIQDYHGRTPLHHCVFTKNNLIAKHLIKRGANPSIKDGGGQTALERAMEFGPVTDEELLILLVGS